MKTGQRQLLNRADKGAGGGLAQRYRHIQTYTDIYRHTDIQIISSGWRFFSFIDYTTIIEFQTFAR